MSCFLSQTIQGTSSRQGLLCGGAKT